MVNSSLEPSDILDIFTEEIYERGGHLRDTYVDDHRLYTRSILPFADEVEPGDEINGGVALKACDSEIVVAPYVFRQVCRNGAVMSRSLFTRRITIADFSTEQTTRQLEDAIDECAREEVFAANTSAIQSTLDHEMDMVFTMTALLQQHRNLSAVMKPIVDMLFGKQDRNAYRVMNAITASAREEQDPQRKWDLEELAAESRHCGSR